MFRLFSSHRSAWCRSLRIGLAVLTIAYGLGGFPASTNPNIPDHLKPGVQQAHAAGGGDGGEPKVNYENGRLKYRQHRNQDGGCPSFTISGVTYGTSWNSDSRLCISNDDDFDPDTGDRSCANEDDLAYEHVYYFRSGETCIIKRRYHDRARSRYCPTNEVFYSTRGCRCPPDKPNCGPPPVTTTLPGQCLYKQKRPVFNGRLGYAELRETGKMVAATCGLPTDPGTRLTMRIETDQTEIVEGETITATVIMSPAFRFPTEYGSSSNARPVGMGVGQVGDFAFKDDQSRMRVNLAAAPGSPLSFTSADSRWEVTFGSFKTPYDIKFSYIARKLIRPAYVVPRGKWDLFDVSLIGDIVTRGKASWSTWDGVSYPSTANQYNKVSAFKLEVPTEDDNVAEDDGTITILLRSASNPWGNPGYYVLSGDEKDGDPLSEYAHDSVTVKVLDNDGERTVTVTSDQSVSGVTEGPYVYATATVNVSPPVPVGETVTVPVTVSQSGDVIYDSASNTGQRSVVLRPTSSPLSTADVKVLIHDDLVDEPSGAVTFSLGQPRAGPGSRVVYKLGTPRSVTVPVFDNDCPAGQHRYANTCHDDHPRGCVASGVGFFRDHRNGDLDDHYNAPKPVCACPSGQHRHGTAACTANHLVPACSPDRDTNYYVHVNGAHVQRSVQQCACAHTATGEPQHRHTVGHRTDNVCHAHPRPACSAANPREYWRIPVSGRRDDGRHDTFTLAACACPSGEHRHGSSGACHDHTPPLCSLEGQSFHTHTSGAQDATDVRDGYVAACPGDLPKIKRVATVRVGESANNAIIRVELNKPVRAGEIGIIRVETVNGTATPNADYKLIRGDDLRVNVGAGERSAVVRIPIVDDTEVEDDEHFTVILEAFGDLRNTRRIARVVIIDDDTPPDTTIEAVSPRVVEGEQVSFVVQLSRTYKDTLRVRVRVRESGDMLTRKADERVHEVRIRPGSTAGYLTLRTQDDQTNEKASNITAVIQNPVTRNLPRYQYNVGTPARAAVRVVDNDRPPPVIGLSSDSAQITEGDTITLKASMLSTRDSDIDVRVNIGETSFAAEAGQTTGDHLQPGWETQHTISIPAGSVSATKVVQTTDDTTDEADSTVTAAVQTHPTYLGTPDTQTVVQDNDNRYNKQTCAEQGKDYDDRLDECFVGFPR